MSPSRILLTPRPKITPDQTLSTSSTKSAIEEYPDASSLHDKPDRNVSLFVHSATVSATLCLPTCIWYSGPWHLGRISIYHTLPPPDRPQTIRNQALLSSRTPTKELFWNDCWPSLLWCFCLAWRCCHFCRAMGRPAPNITTSPSVWSVPWATSKPQSQLSCLSLCWWLKKTNLNRWLVLAFAFVVGGGIGNLIDRIAYGSVTDFFQIKLGIFKTGIFNMADVSVTIGVLLILFLSIGNRKLSI